MQVIDKLVTGIRGCAVASGAVAMLEILTTLGKASPVANVLDWAADTAVAYCYRSAESCVLLKASQLNKAPRGGAETCRISVIRPFAQLQS